MKKCVVCCFAGFLFNAGIAQTATGIPPVPVSVTGVNSPVVSLDGTWRFTRNPTDGWSANVKVPGELAMQGHDVKQDEPWFYERDFTLPAEFAGHCAIIRFDGVYSYSRIWVNGNYIRDHVGGFTAFDCDVTPFVKPGEKATIRVEVTDRRNDPSWASIYAHHNIAGINRSVRLIALPKIHITKLDAETTFDSAFENATLTITAARTPGDATLAFKLFAPDGRPVASGAVQSQAPSFSIACPVAAPLKWDAEHPNLYRLAATLKADGKILETTERRIGFRQITYGGANGTDPGKIYVNGKEVKLRGTCRHDITHDRGRSTTPAEDLAEIKAYKAHNINFIRTSHYPVTEALLNACDEIGMYVEEESASNFLGQGGIPSAPVDDHFNQFTEMITRDRNHPCIIIWSLANECTFTQTPAFIKMFAWVKEQDPTRPIIYSWPNTIPKETSPRPYDIYAHHYAGATGALARPGIPTLHEEYAHIACYNIGELRRDPGVRNFWSYSIKHFWDRIEATDGALGGALWGGIDDVFFLPEGIPERHQRHATGALAGYGEWGSVLDVFRRLKPEAFITKKAYSPIRVTTEGVVCPEEGQPLTLSVKNRFDHTNLSEVNVKWRVGRDRGTMTLPAIAPHTSGTFTLPARKWNAQETLRLDFITPDGRRVERENIVFGTPSLTFTPSASRVAASETPEALTLTDGGAEWIFCKKSASLIRASLNGKTLLTGGPLLTLNGSLPGVWKGESLTWQAPNLTLKGTFGNTPATFTLTFPGGGIAEITGIASDAKPFQKASEYGIAFTLASEIDRIGWLRKGLWSWYPANHIGRNVGSTLRYRPGHETTPDRYGTMPQWSWAADMRDYFLYAKDSPDDGLATRDFRAQRENILYYTLHLPHAREHIRIVDPTGQTSARTGISRRRPPTIDDRDPALTYTGKWEPYNTPADFNGSETFSKDPGASCSLTFEGTGIRLIGARQPNTGTIKIFLDGTLHLTIDTYEPAGEMKQRTLWTIENLPPGEHTLRVEALGDRFAVIDAFEIAPLIPPTGEELTLYINTWWDYPGLGWGNLRKPAPGLKETLTCRATLHLRDSDKDMTPIIIPHK